MRYIPLIFIGLFITACSESSPEDSLYIYDTDLILGCDYPDNETLEQSAQELTDAGIDVLSSSCAVIIDAVWTQQCPNITGQINIHKIHFESLIDAEPLGYESTEKLSELANDEKYGPNGDLSNYEIVECPVL